jgi:hypothetical protein
LSGFDIITINPHLITSNDIFQKSFIVICSLEEIFIVGKSLQFLIINQEFGTNVSETCCFPKPLIKIAWLEPMNIASSSVTSWSQSTVFIDNVIHLGSRYSDWLRAGRPGGAGLRVPIG